MPAGVSNPLPQGVYLKKDGSNADTNINIGGFDFETTGNITAAGETIQAADTVDALLELKTIHTAQAHQVDIYTRASASGSYDSLYFEGKTAGAHFVVSFKAPTGKQPTMQWMAGSDKVDMRMENSDLFFRNQNADDFISFDVRNTAQGYCRGVKVDGGIPEVIINDQLKDLNFRVKGDTDATLFFCDAGLDKVGVGVIPTEKFHVGGNAKIDANLNVQGTMQFGIYAGAAGESFAGFVTINDAGGTPRKVMVCA